MRGSKPRRWSPSHAVCNPVGVAMILPDHRTRQSDPGLPPDGGGAHIFRARKPTFGTEMKVSATGGPCKAGAADKSGTPPRAEGPRFRPIRPETRPIRTSPPKPAITHRSRPAPPAATSTHPGAPMLLFISVTEAVGTGASSSVDRSHRSVAHSKLAVTRLPIERPMTYLFRYRRPARSDIRIFPGRHNAPADGSPGRVVGYRSGQRERRSVRARRKKIRLAGRSASRRMK